jgi:hypothetical protein
MASPARRRINNAAPDPAATSRGKLKFGRGGIPGARNAVPPPRHEESESRAPQTKAEV